MVDKEERIYLLFALMAALICIFFALGPKAMWMDTVVYEISLGPVMYKLWSMVRSSYRLAWAVVYGSIIVLVWALAKWNRKWCAYIISAGVFIQMVDMVPFWQDVKVNMENVMLSQESDLVSETWSELGRTKSKIIIMNADDRSNAIGSVVGLTRGELYDFADLALEYDMEMNDFYYARKDSTALANARASVWKELYSGAADESAIYVFLENPVRLLQEEALSFYKIDGYLIGVAGPIELHEGDEEYQYRCEQPISVLPLPGEYLDQGEKGENGERIILPGGQSYGPRISLNKGRYAVEIVGEGLDEANIYCTAQGEDVPWEKAEKTERGIRYEFILEEMKTKVEFVVENSSGQDVIVHDILLEEIDSLLTKM